MRIIPFFLFLNLMFVNFALAEPTASCHCFKDRKYDSQRAFASDPYFLATTQNALLAKLSGLSKKSVVSAKMGGADGDRMWVVHYLAHKSGKPFGEVEALYSEKGGWSEVVQQLKIDPEHLDPRFVAALNDQRRLSMVVVDEQLVMHLAAEPLQLRRLREQGANNQQTIIAVFIDQLSPLEATELFAQVAGAKISWGGLLAEQGLFNGSDIESTWHQLLEKSGK